MTKQHRHQLEIKGYNELLAEHCELVDRVARLEAQLERVEHIAVALSVVRPPSTAAPTDSADSTSEHSPETRPAGEPNR